MGKLVGHLLVFLFHIIYAVSGSIDELLPEMAR